VSSIADTNAIEMLSSQHDEIANLFDDLEDETSLTRKREVFETLADALAVHVTIEERHFYPAVRARNTEVIVEESFEEHMGIKLVLADMLATPIDDETFDAKTAPFGSWSRCTSRRRSATCSPRSSCCWTRTRWSPSPAR
jgi:hemerythrin superfamily protein